MDVKINKNMLPVSLGYAFRFSLLVKRISYINLIMKILLNNGCQFIKYDRRCY